MRVFVDSSVLIASFYVDHQHHDSSFRVLQHLEPGASFCGAHSLVETYSSLTRMPGTYRVSGDRAYLYIQRLRDKLQAVALTEAEHSEMLGQYAALGIVGGAIYDALLANCAIKAGAEVLITWNVRHFRRLGAGVARLVKTPLEIGAS